MLISRKKIAFRIGDSICLIGDGHYCDMSFYLSLSFSSIFSLAFFSAWTYPRSIYEGCEERGNIDISGEGECVVKSRRDFKVYNFAFLSFLLFCPFQKPLGSRNILDVFWNFKHAEKLYALSDLSKVKGKLVLLSHLFEAKWQNYTKRWKIKKDNIEGEWSRTRLFR